jgi:Mrp family chromosome partitioning ATPase
MNNEIQIHTPTPVTEVTDPFLASEPGAPLQDHGFARIQRLLRHRYRWCLLLGTVLATAGVFAGLTFFKPQWVCGGMVQVTPPPPPIIPGAVVDHSDPVGYDNLIQSQMALIRSARVVEMAMDDDKWREAAPDRPCTDPQSVVKFRDSLAVIRAGGQYVYVTFADRDPGVARTATGLVLAAYRKIAVDQLLTARMNTDKTRMAEREKYRTTIGSYDQSIHNEGTEDLHPMYLYKQGELARKNSLIDDVKVSLAAMGDPARGPTTRPRRPEDLTVDDIAAIAPGLDLLIRDQKEAEAEFDRVVNIFKLGPEHTIYQSAKAKFDRRTKEVADFVAQWREKARNNPGIMPEDPVTIARTSLQNRLKEYEQQRDKLQEDVLDYRRRLDRVDNFIKERTKVQAQFDEISNIISAAEIEQKNQPQITVAEEPDKPLPGKDLRIQMACIGGFGGMFMGFIIVLGFASADRRLRSPEDMRGAVQQLALLGVLPALPENLTDPEQAAIAAHCVHQMRTILQISTAAPNHNVFVVTSPAAGTGKTSLTLSLGVSFAAGKSRTLIVDCDLIGGGLTTRVSTIIRRKIGRIFQLEGLITPQQLEAGLRLAHGSRKKLGEALVELGYLKAEDVLHALSVQEHTPVGVLDALAGEKLDDCIAETGIANLAILPLGAARPGDVSRLSPTSIRALLARCREQFDTIVIDTGPIPGSLEASVVAAAADGVVLVVSRGEHRPMAERAIQHLHDIGAHVSGLVFNRARVRDIEQSTTHTRVSSIARSQRSSVPPSQSGRFGPMAQAVTKADPDAPSPNPEAHESQQP